MSNRLIDTIKSKGLTYPKYLDLINNEVFSTHSDLNSDEEKQRFEDKKLNLHRMNRIDKQYFVPDEVKLLVLQISKPQIWMIISETWCGDSAQNIPYISKIASINPNINLRILLRDENPEIMDLYVTNGTRSIPILVIFDEEGNELAKWGPRPDEAKQLVNNLIAQGLDKKIRAEKLHLWYGRNRGKNLEMEITDLLKAILFSEIEKTLS
ncbi:MAG: thioredoxin family protein [Ignavibacteriaceae bacterium]|nr:thioredoxin family protein [Ignavibacteriaceae bacterium]